MLVAELPGYALHWISKRVLRGGHPTDPRETNHSHGDGDMHFGNAQLQCAKAFEPGTSASLADLVRSVSAAAVEVWATSVAASMPNPLDGLRSPSYFGCGPCTSQPMMT